MNLIQHIAIHILIYGFAKILEMKLSNIFWNQIKYNNSIYNDTCYLT